MANKLETNLCIKFKNPELLHLACIHRSATNEQNITEHNERLEFLGDAVLELATTEYLYAKFPERPEGELTMIRSALVRGQHLAEVAQKLEVGEYLILSKGEERGGGRTKDYLLANAVEAIIGAIYLDQGYAKAQEFIAKFILCDLEKILEQNLHVDAKSHFQEIVQEEQGVTPSYKLIGESGPDHAKIFIMGAYIAEHKVGEGSGSSKQTAETAAAQNALERLGKI